MPLSGAPGRYRRGRLQGARSNQNLTAGISKLPFVPILNVSLAQQVGTKLSFELSNSLISCKTEVCSNLNL